VLQVALVALDVRQQALVARPVKAVVALAAHLRVAPVFPPLDKGLGGSQQTGCMQRCWQACMP
jgi:hypothetical protein